MEVLGTNWDGGPGKVGKEGMEVLGIRGQRDGGLQDSGGGQLREDPRET